MKHIALIIIPLLMLVHCGAGSEVPSSFVPGYSKDQQQTEVEPCNTPGPTPLNSPMASITPTPTPAPSCILGDVNCDGCVNGQDLALVSSNWLMSGPAPLAGDANGDGIVNGQDSALVSSHWLEGCMAASPTPTPVVTPTPIPREEPSPTPTPSPSATATPTPSPTPSPKPRIPGDVNFDGCVNGQDIALVSSNWLRTGPVPLTGDANDDGIVNGQDIALISSHWLEGCGM